MGTQAPGFSTEITTQESAIFWSGWGGHGVASQRVTIDSTVTDAGNTGFTSTIRGGQILAIKIADGNAYLYDPDASGTGLDVPAGVLHESTNLLDVSGTAADTTVNMITKGYLHENELINSDRHAEIVFAKMGLYYDTINPGRNLGGIHMTGQSFVEDDTTLSATYEDNGTLFVASVADVDFILPATIVTGLCYEFIRVDNFEIKISGSNNILTINDLSASSITYTVTAQQTGVHLRVRSIYTSPTTLKWVVEALHNNAAIFVVGAIT